MNANYKNVISFMWTTDLPKALAFYSDVLGLKKVFESDGWCELSIPGTRNAYLALNVWTREGRPPRNEFVTLGVDDLDIHRERLEYNGVRLKGDVLSFEEQGLRMLKFYDPEGNVITLAEVRL